MNDEHPILLNPDVVAVFDAYPKVLQDAVRRLRALILDTAASLSEVGEIEKTLRWGQPSYLTSQSKSGSMIRIDRVKAAPNQYALICSLPDQPDREFQGTLPGRTDVRGESRRPVRCRRRFPGRYCAALHPTGVDLPAPETGCTQIAIGRGTPPL